MPYGNGIIAAGNFDYQCPESAAYGRKTKKAPFSDKIDFIRDLILESTEPGTIKKIFLFGSYAYGRPTKKSDVDLCVIVNDGLDVTKEYMKMALGLYKNNIIPVDLMVYEDKIFYDIKNPNGIKNTILTKGKILYE